MPRPAARGGDPLEPYRKARNFDRTPEPTASQGRATGKATKAASTTGLQYVIQKHAARSLHYDFRLELDGVLLSWAVPKGPSLDPADKRLAVHVEDHPLAYGSFEGTIPAGQYGAGTVIVWDRGTWQPVSDPHKGLAAGKLEFELHGQKLRGRWELIRMEKPDERQESWLLFKKRDPHARPRSEYDVLRAQPDSVMGAQPQRSATPSRPQRKARTVAKLPTRLGPQLARVTSSLPSGDQWLFELKFDGYRLMARIEGQRVGLYTRAGHDWSERMPAIVDALRALPLQTAWLDGEIVVLGRDGNPDFGALQNAFDRSDRGAPIRYFLFDLPFLDGQDLRELPLAQRRERLATLLEGVGEPLRLSEAFAVGAASMLKSAKALGLEGVMAKRADAPYTSGRSDHWRKLKFRLRQEFVVCGYTRRSDGTNQIGSLMLGAYDAEGQMHSVGSVGTGWNSAEAQRLLQLLEPLRVSRAPFTASSDKRRKKRPPAPEQWVRPQRVAEVAFGAWTADRQIRHAVYVGLREDRDAREIGFEPANGAMTGAPAASAGRADTAESSTTTNTTASGMAATTGNIGTAAIEDAFRNLRITHGERVVDSVSGATKRDVVRYWESIAPWLLPHLHARPVALLRAPNGVAGERFFQKHDERKAIVGLQRLDRALLPEHEALLVVSDATALAGAAQANVLEFHTWNALASRLDRPDRMVFDLDPGEGVAWESVREGALLVRTLLSELGLRSWLKTSGGKGLHVVVPLAPRNAGTEAVRAVSQQIVEHLAATIPSRFVAVSGPANRKGRIYVDYLRNGFGATTVAAYSLRARAGLGVSMPLAWDALEALPSPTHFNIDNARDHVSTRKEDPWADYSACRQTITNARRMLAAAAPARR